MDIRPPEGWKGRAQSASSRPTELPVASSLPPAQTVLPADLTPPPTKQVQKSAGWWAKHWRMVAGCVAGLVVLLLAAGSWYVWALTPKSADATRQPFTVHSGDSVSTIANGLQEQGLVHSALAFQFYVNFAGVATQLQAGHYRLAPNQSVTDIVTTLTHPQEEGYSVIILPGMTLKELADPTVENSLADQGFSEEEIEAAFTADYTSPLLRDKPTEASLEGYIFPETYNMRTNDTLEMLFERTFDELYERLEADGLVEKLAARGFNLHQALTLASIVQKEVSDPAVQPQVAQVFERRLSIGMQLGSDVTFIYAAEQDGAEPSVEYESPYNTRKYDGLPPGPIANMNYSALEAVATPAEGDYLYFVAGDDGRTHFSRTEAEHLELVRTYCTKLCS